MKTVLLVEDDPIQRRLMGFALRPLQLRILEGGDTESALAHPDPIDLVITDHTMPGRSGIELIAELRTRPGQEQLPAILLTGRGEPAIQEEAALLGRCEVVGKPFSPTALAERVRATLGL